MEQIQANYQESRTAHEATIAKEHYAWTEDQVRRLDEGDTTVIAEFGARVYTDAVTGAMAQMLSHLPEMIGNVLEARGQGEASEKQFYAANPHIDPDAHGETVKNMAASYRQMNPQATQEQAIQEIGAMVTVALRLPQDAAPVAPVPPTPPPVPAFQPAGAGGNASAIPTAQTAIETFNEEFDVDDLDLG
ncbi:MAG: hypothetical protein V3R51_01020 [Gammaproteobacteria bacterium]